MPPTNYIYIDHQNTGEIDLAPVAGVSACVILCLGPKTEKLPAAFQKNLLKFTHVRFLKSVVEGRNAVDFLIAKDIGIQIAHDPKASFHIISKDKDFDSLIQNLCSDQIPAARWKSYADIQFSPAPGHQHSGPHPSSKRDTASPTIADYAARLTETFAKTSKNRPRTITRLRGVIRNNFKHLTPAAIEEVLDALKAKTLIIDQTGKVTYFD